MRLTKGDFVIIKRGDSLDLVEILGFDLFEITFKEFLTYDLKEFKINTTNISNIVKKV